MIYRIVKLHFQTTKTASFLELFNQVVTKVNEQPGCIEMYMIQDLHNPAIFITHSKWEQEQDLNNYRNSALFKTIWPTIKPWFEVKAEAWSMQLVTN